MHGQLKWSKEGGEGAIWGTREGGGGSEERAGRYGMSMIDPRFGWSQVGVRHSKSEPIGCERHAGKSEVLHALTHNTS